jgi:hypothetical protein
VKNRTRRYFINWTSLVTFKCKIFIQTNGRGFFAQFELEPVEGTIEKVNKILISYKNWIKKLTLNIIKY